jgi:MFS family permease
MNLFFDSFWRALSNCVLPRVILLSLLPLLLMVAISVLLGVYFWDDAIAAVQDYLEDLELFDGLLQWLDAVGAQTLRNVIAPLIVLTLMIPLLVIATLMAVACLMTPALVNLVSARRFPLLERRHGGSFFVSILLGLGSSLMALLAIVVSMPLWFIPPLVMILPPLIWGWLTYRVMSFDVLAEHASPDERREILRRHRLMLLFMGVCCGLLGAAPGLIWVFGALLVVLAPLLLPLAVWIYTFVFAFSALWFAHFCLAALQALRDSNPPPATPPPTDVQLAMSPLT